MPSAIPTSCRWCYTQYLSKRKAFYHSIECAQRPEGRVTCRYCKARFCSGFELAAHLRSLCPKKPSKQRSDAPLWRPSAKRSASPPTPNKPALTKPHLSAASWSSTPSIHVEETVATVQDKPTFQPKVILSRHPKKRPSLVKLAAVDAAPAPPVVPFTLEEVVQAVKKSIAVPTVKEIVQALPPTPPATPLPVPSPSLSSQSLTPVLEAIKDIPHEILLHAAHNPDLSPNCIMLKMFDENSYATEAQVKSIKTTLAVMHEDQRMMNSTIRDIRGVVDMLSSCMEPVCKPTRNEPEPELELARANSESESEEEVQMPILYNPYTNPRPDPHAPPRKPALKPAPPASDSDSDSDYDYYYSQPVSRHQPVNTTLPAIRPQPASRPTPMPASVRSPTVGRSSQSVQSLARLYSGAPSVPSRSSASSSWHSAPSDPPSDAQHQASIPSQASSRVSIPSQSSVARTMSEGVSSRLDSGSVNFDGIPSWHGSSQVSNPSAASSSSPDPIAHLPPAIQAGSGADQVNARSSSSPDPLALVTKAKRKKRRGKGLSKKEGAERDE